MLDDHDDNHDHDDDSDDSDDDDTMIAAHPLQAPSRQKDLEAYDL